MKRIIFFFSIFSITQNIHCDILNPINYLSLDHKISLDIFRAGNHVENKEYYLKVSSIGQVVKSSVDSKQPIQKTHQLLGVFAKIKLPPLKYWQNETPKKRSTKNSFEVKGGYIRKIISKTMNDFNAKESEVSVEIKIELAQTKPKWLILTKEEIIDLITYYVIPSEYDEQELKKNQVLLLKDQLGTHAKISVTY